MASEDSTTTGGVGKGSGGVGASTGAEVPGSTGGDPTGGAAASTDEGSGETGTSGPGLDSDDDSGSSTGATGGSEDTGEPMLTTCSLPGCWQECSELVTPAGKNDFGPCHIPMEDFTEAGCQTEALCPTLSWYESQFEPASFVANAQCFLQALHGGAAGHVEYTMYPDEWDNRWGTIHIVGDGTVVLDMWLGGHCGDGGGYSTRPIKTRNLDVLAANAEPLASCLQSQDAQELFACVLGEDNEIASSPDALPWLAGSCADAEPWCGK